MSETFLDGKVTLWAGDCLDVLARLEENSIDSCVCDPPYHLQSIVKRFAKTGRTDKTRTTSGPHQRTANGFMNKVWDGGDIAFRVETWRAALRVLKPGAYIVAFSSSRTFGRMSVAIEDAGFITHPLFGWIFGQGFPKAHKVHAPGWEGWRYGGQACKPALEPVYIGQKPFSEKTGTANVLCWGTGALNIDGCRVHSDDAQGGAYTVTLLKPGATLNKTGGNWRPESGGIEYHGETPPGRWPANVITDGSEEVLAAFPESAGQLFGTRPDHKPKVGTAVYGDYGPRPFSEPRGDEGSAARFFYAAKADTDDRLGSSHPTIKPLDLIQYLVRLVTPPNGIVLDCFAGTGTTGEAAWREGMRAVLIEREAEYQADIRRRMKLAACGPDERGRESIKARGLTADAGPLFGGLDKSRGGRQIYGVFADENGRRDQSGRPD